MNPDGDLRVIHQDLMQFTVKIRHPRTAAVLGTGVLVSADGIIVTCVHVLTAHGIDPADPLTVVDVYFPARDDRPAHVDLARVAWISDGDHSDDLLCLRTERPVPVPADRVAVLGTSELSRDHRFQSFGYRPLGRYPGGLAEGRILGRVVPPETLRLYADPVQLKSSDISAGMSGAAVLDLDRNLVVGLVAQAYYAEETGKDRDTAWAVDAKVIGFTGLEVPLRTEALHLQHAERPRYNQAFARRAVPAPGHRLDDAPAPLEDWVGRRTQLEDLDGAAHDERRQVIGVIGLGGEGKSSLVRRWVDAHLEEDDEQVAGALWWSFTERTASDEFLDAAIEFMSGGQVDPAKAAVEGGGRPAVAFGMMSRRRYVLVLDGLEVAQHHRGDRYATIVSDELRDFLQYAATPGSRSLVLITSRLPMLDLAPYVTYQQVTVGALSVGEGRDLLSRLGVVGSDAAIDQVVRDWDGHVLTLSLVGTYLKRRYDGDVRKVTTLPPPEPGEARDAHVRRILAEYDHVLTGAERVVLDRMSLFRTPVPEAAIRMVLAGAPDLPSWAELRTTALRYLILSRIVRRDSGGRYSMHPLVRDFYVQHGDGPPADRARLHAIVRDYYLTEVTATPAPQTLEDLVPALEAVHHCARAGAYDQACDLAYDRLYLGGRGFLTKELNAYETALAMFADFFDGQDVWSEPKVTDRESRAWILHEVATCLQLLGRLRDAAMMFRRAAEAFRQLGADLDAAVSVQNLAELFLTLGALPACHQLVSEAFQLADPGSEDELVAQTLRGSLASLEGRHQVAETAFDQALHIARTVTPVPVLYSSSGSRYAEHLRRTGRPAEARQTHQLNLRICQEARWQADVVLSHIGLGRLDLESGDSDAALAHFDEAVNIARGITRRDVLVSALSARGLWALRAGRQTEAQQFLDQSRNLAELGGYRVAEIDTMIGLAELSIAAGDLARGRELLNEAEQVSLEIGYHWGVVDAQAARP